MAKGPISLPSRQQRLGVPKVRSIIGAGGTGSKSKERYHDMEKGEMWHMISERFKLHADFDNVTKRRGLLRAALSSRHVPPVLNADPIGSHLTGFLL